MVWNLDAIGRLLLGMCCTLMLGGVLSGLFPGPEQHFERFLISALAFHGASLGWVHLLLRDHQASWRTAFGLDASGRARAVGLAVCAAAAVLPFAWTLSEVSAWLMRYFLMEPVAQPAVQALQATTSPQELWLMGLVAVGLAPVAEEILFRGIAYPALRQWLGRAPALWLTSLAFGAIHQNVMTFVALAGFGWVLAWLYERTGTLIAPTAAHSAFNLINFAFLVRHGAVQ